MNNDALSFAQQVLADQPFNDQVGARLTGFADGTVLGPGVVTGGLTIHYLRAARHGVLRAVGVVAHHTSRQAVCTAQIEKVAPDGTITLCAVASGTVLATGRPLTVPRHEALAAEPA